MKENPFEDERELPLGARVAVRYLHVDGLFGEPKEIWHQGTVTQKGAGFYEVRFDESIKPSREGRMLRDPGETISIPDNPVCGHDPKTYEPIYRWRRIAQKETAPTLDR